MTVVFKGNKVATVQEYNTVLIGAMNMTTAGEEKKRPMVTESKRQMLKEMAEKSADDLSRDQKEQFSHCRVSRTTHCCQTLWQEIELM